MFPWYILNEILVLKLKNCWLFSLAARMCFECLFTAGLLSVLTLGLVRRGTVSYSQPTPILADASLQLLLMLTNHCSAHYNPYRIALFSFASLAGEYSFTLICCMD